MYKSLLKILVLLFILAGCTEKHKKSNQIETTNDKQLNVVFILSDDHRYDFMGFTGKVPFLKTPAMDKMAKEGVHIQNAFVSTSLCSPSRASILTGQYTHHHGVVDNQSLVPEGTIFFPKYLQNVGYETAFIGKWHMGEHHDDPRDGFDYWASFRGQGPYWDPNININGQHRQYEDSSYVTEVLTDLAINFLDSHSEDKPFFLYLSHKAVHAEFLPAQKHRKVYEKEPLIYPPTMYPPGHQKSTLKEGEIFNYEDVPAWVKKQRYSWHGVDYLYHGALTFDEFYRRYCETLLAVDESISTVTQYLEDNDLLDNTVVFYMGDNGFSFGEHGLIDKRQAYEESIRVPLLAFGADLQKGLTIDEVVQNIDIAPTILSFANVDKPEQMDGNSFEPLLRGQEMNWKDTIYYEYFWERPFPQTPTVHAVRTDRYKYIRYHGIWDLNELYDLREDPFEMNNLIRSPEHKKIAKDLRQALFHWLNETEGDIMYIKNDGKGARFDHGYKKTY